MKTSVDGMVAEAILRARWGRYRNRGGARPARRRRTEPVSVPVAGQSRPSAGGRYREGTRLKTSGGWPEAALVGTRTPRLAQNRTVLTGILWVVGSGPRGERCQRTTARGRRRTSGTGSGAPQASGNASLRSWPQEKAKCRCRGRYRNRLQEWLSALEALAIGLSHLCVARTRRSSS
jgi:hypothetical protein